MLHVGGTEHAPRGLRRCTDEVPMGKPATLPLAWLLCLTFLPSLAALLWAQLCSCSTCGQTSQGILDWLLLAPVVHRHTNRLPPVFSGIVHLILTAIALKNSLSQLLPEQLLLHGCSFSIHLLDRASATLRLALTYLSPSSGCRFLKPRAGYCLWVSEVFTRAPRDTY